MKGFSLQLKYVCTHSLKKIIKTLKNTINKKGTSMKILLWNYCSMWAHTKMDAWKFVFRICESTPESESCSESECSVDSLSWQSLKEPVLYGETQLGWGIQPQLWALFMVKMQLVKIAWHLVVPILVLAFTLFCCGANVHNIQFSEQLSRY